MRRLARLPRIGGIAYGEIVLPATYRSDSGSGRSSALNMLAHPMLVDRDRTIVMQATSFIEAGYLNAKNKHDIRHYFEYSAQGVDLVEDGLKEISFGEFLVDQGVLDRYQLFRALQMQDRLPGVRLGEAAAALGYAPIGAIERLFTRFQQLNSVEVD